VHYLINDVLMAFFFLIAGKEVWEAIILKNGSLRGRRALTPLFATAGGMAGPVAVYLGLAALLGSDVFDAVARGWAIPTATDIAFSYIVGRIVFGAGHPAVRFLLLLAIADDAAGLIILAMFYPTGAIWRPEWLLLSAGRGAGRLCAVQLAAAGARWRARVEAGIDADSKIPVFLALCARRRGKLVRLSAGRAASRAGAVAGDPGGAPCRPVVRHLLRGRGTHLTDLLNRIEHILKLPVEMILFFFGLANAGVEFSARSVCRPGWCWPG
jgi:NhaA family Na+:H+ antiporter